MDRAKEVENHCSNSKTFNPNLFYFKVVETRETTKFHPVEEQEEGRQSRSLDGNDNLIGDPVSLIDGTQEILEILNLQSMPIVYASQLIGFYIYTGRSQNTFVKTLQIKGASPAVVLAAKKKIFRTIEKWCQTHCMDF